jgi:hypothetical protein
MDDDLLSLLRFAPRTAFRAAAAPRDDLGQFKHRLPLWVTEAPAGLLEAIVVHFRERGRQRIAEDVAALIRYSGVRFRVPPISCLIVDC